MRNRPSGSDLVDHVDLYDRPIGQGPRERVRSEPGCFRVCHVFLFNQQDELLLQQLGTERTLAPGRWGSSVAAHVLSGESYGDAALRRMDQELGVRVPLQEVGTITFPEATGVKFVALFQGTAEQASIREPEHVAALRFSSLEQVAQDCLEDPQSFTDTFRVLVAAYLGHRS